MIKIILYIFLLLTSKILYSQVSFSAIHNKENILIKIYASGPDSLLINSENFKLVNYDCFDNVVFLYKSSIQNEEDSIVKFKLSTTNTDHDENKIILSNGHLRLRLISDLKFKLKSSKKVYIELMINNQLVIIESKYKKIKFCKKIDGAPEFKNDSPVYYIDRCKNN